MYRACIYCQRRFGANDSVETFPFGRRIAFDAARGRLWIVCEVCRRWNLSPLEERWEAIEECERQFHETHQSYSTENIGLARLPDGLEIVRIGAPRRHEFAAWRYGREFLRRRVRSVIATGTKVAVSAAGVLVGADIFWVFIVGRKNRVVARLRSADGARMSVTRKDLGRVELARGEAGDGWALLVSYHPGERFGLLGARGTGRRRHAILSGPAAVRAASRLLPKVNDWGGTEAQVRAAVAMIEESRNPERLFSRVAGDPDSIRALGPVRAGSIFLKRMDGNVRLALEMAAHEESERRALEGELAILEAAWREAEEIASIADRLLIPDAVESWILRQKGKLTRGSPP